MTTDQLSVPEVGASGSALDQVYGVLTIGESQVALPLAGLREVIPCPQQLISLPSPAPGLLGAVDLRGHVIPVLDLRVVLGMSTERHVQQVVVVVIHDGRVLGLLADEVGGVTTTSPESLHAMSAVGEVELLFSHSFERYEDNSVVSVLDVGAICRLPGTPLIRDSDPVHGAPVPGQRPAHAHAGADAGAGAGLKAQAQGRSILLMRCGEIGLGLEIEHVHATLPRLDVRASPLTHGICLGVVDYGGVQVPVIDPLQLMGMGVLPPDRVQGIVLRFDVGLVVLLITEVIDIVSVNLADLMTLPPFAVRNPGFFGGVIQADELGDYLMLTSAALMDSPELLTLATFNLSENEGGQPAGGRADWAGDPQDGQDPAASTLYLTYTVTDECASPLDQVLEILPYPKDFASIGEVGGVVLGLLTHRESVVPLISLATLMGSPQQPDPAQACVLLVGAGEGTIGLVVRSLGAIERSVWEEQDEDLVARTTSNDPVEQALAQKRTIRTAPVGSVGAERMLPRIDLVAVAAALATGGWR
jgi:purine-binding chemotaxis protein CheW